MNHWVIAPVVLPAVLAPIIVLWMRHDIILQRVFSVIGTLALLAIAIFLCILASDGHVEVYKLGNWEAPFGIVLVLDQLAALMVLITALLAVAVVLYAIGSGWDAKGWHFHSLLQFQLMGICGAFLTGDAFNLFVFFEVLLIASYGLMIHGGGQHRLRAGVQYVVYNLAGSCLFLFALGTIYSVTGTLNMADLAVKIAQIPAGETGLLRVGVVLLLMVFAIKAALVPFQFWLPGTYVNAPGPVAALFAVMTKVGIYAILRMGTLAVGPESTLGTLSTDLLQPAALITLVIGMVGVLGAKDMGRTVAFSVIGSVGTMMLAFGQFTEAATGAGLYYMVHSTFAAAALFLIVDLVRARRGATGLALVPAAPIVNHGLLAAMFFAGAIAMAGMPPLSGFVGKLLIMDALRPSPEVWIYWAAILVTSLIAIMGFGLSGSMVFWKAYAVEGSAEREALEPAPAQALAITSVMGLLGVLVVLTLGAGPISAWLRETAAQIHAPGAYIAAVLGVAG